MSIWRIITAAIFAIPMIIWLGFNMVIGLGASGLTKTMSGEDASGVEQVAMEGSARIIGVAFNLYGNFKENQLVKIMFDQHALDAKRAIKFSEDVSLTALLDAGEAEPDAVYRLLYATARAPAYVNQECVRLSQSIASRCLVRDVKVRALREGSFRISANILFAPSTPIGEMREAEGAEPNYVETKSRLDLIGGEVIVPSGQYHLARDIFYQRSEQYCAALRVSTGNCVLQSMRFTYHDIRGDGGMMKATAVAHFGMLSIVASPKEDEMTTLLNNALDAARKR